MPVDDSLMHVEEGLLHVDESVLPVVESIIPLDEIPSDRFDTSCHLENNKFTIGTQTDTLDKIPSERVDTSFHLKNNKVTIGTQTDEIQYISVGLQTTTTTASTGNFLDIEILRDPATSTPSKYGNEKAISDVDTTKSTTREIDLSESFRLSSNATSESESIDSEEDTLLDTGDSSTTYDREKYIMFFLKISISYSPGV